MKSMNEFTNWSSGGPFFEEEIEHLNMVEILERLVGVWQAGTFE